MLGLQYIGLWYFETSLSSQCPPGSPKSWVFLFWHRDLSLALILITPCISVGGLVRTMKSILTFYQKNYCCYDGNFYFPMRIYLSTFKCITSQSNLCSVDSSTNDVEIMKKQTIYFLYIFLVHIGRKYWQRHKSGPTSTWYRSVLVVAS